MLNLTTKKERKKKEDGRSDRYLSKFRAAELLRETTEEKHLGESK